MVRHAVGFLVWMSAVGEGLGEETTIFWRKTCCFHWKGGGELLQKPPIAGCRAGRGWQGWVCCPAEQFGSRGHGVDASTASCVGDE